jgi:hypothetical protein
VHCYQSSSQKDYRNSGVATLSSYQDISQRKHYSLQVHELKSAAEFSVQLRRKTSFHCAIRCLKGAFLTRETLSSSLHFLILFSSYLSSLKYFLIFSYICTIFQSAEW